jgi:hypothetical protein
MLTKEEVLKIFTSKEAAWFAYKEGLQTGHNEAYGSIRNQAAIAALQGLLGNPNRLGDAREYAKAAVDFADALVEELKKEKS